MDKNYIQTPDLKIGDVINRDSGGYTMTILAFESIEPQPFSSFIWYSFLVISNIDPYENPVYRHRFYQSEWHLVIDNIGEEKAAILLEES